MSKLDAFGARWLGWVPGLSKAVRGRRDSRFAEHFLPDLLSLHDVLESTPLAGRYWVWAGVLLGWAREGQLLPHDRDADFGVMAEDLDLVTQLVPTLREAGFEPLHKFRNNEGRDRILAFTRHGARFEFYAFDRAGDKLRYQLFGWPPDRLVELEAELPDQELVPFEFLGRTWLRHADYELELRSIYGDWQTPQRDFDYLEDELSTVDRRPWINSDSSWTA
jgi:hypothetical protein